MSNWIAAAYQKLESAFATHKKVTESELAVLTARVDALEKARGTPPPPPAAD